jgi:hypothetical protein
MDERKAARVLPDPVGATTRVFSPRPMASHAPACAGVGSAKLAVNQSRTSGENRSRAAAGGAATATDVAAAAAGAGAAARGAAACRSACVVRP